MPRGDPPRAGHRLGAIVTAMIAGMLGLFAPATTGAQTTPSGLTIVDQRFALTAGSPWTASFALAAAPATRPPAVTVTVHEAVGDLTGLDDLASDGGAIVDTVDVDATATIDGAWSVEVATALGPATTADPTLSVPAPGVYPVSISGGAAGVASTTATTFMTVVDPDGAPVTLRVAVLAGVADPGPWPDDADVVAARREIADATTLADAVDAPLTFRLPPSLVGPVAASDPGADAAGASTVPSGSAPATQSATSPSTLPDGSAGVDMATAFAGDELLSQTAIPLDPSALVTVDETALFTEQLVVGESAASAGLPLATRSRAAWVAEADLSAPAARLLRTLGFQLVVTAPVGDDPTPAAVRIALDDGQLASVAISSLGSQLGPAGDAGAVATAARLAASVELVRAAGDRSPLVLARDDLALPDPAVTAAFARFVGETPGLAVTRLSDLAGAATIAASGTTISLAATAGADLSWRVDAVDAIGPRADQATSMLVDPAPAAAWQAEFDGLLATTIDDAEAASHLGATTDDVDGVLAAVSASGPSQLTITGTTTELPITLSNTSDTPLNVIVRVRSPKLTSPEQPPYTVLPGQEQVVMIPVTARSNGTFTLEVDVLSPDHQRLTDPLVMKATVRRVAGLSQVVTAGAVLVLATWWFSHLRRNRKARMAAVDAAPATGGTELSPDAAEARTGPPVSDS